MYYTLDGDNREKSHVAYGANSENWGGLGSGGGKFAGRKDCGTEAPVVLAHLFDSMKLQEKADTFSKSLVGDARPWVSKAFCISSPNSQ